MQADVSDASRYVPPLTGIRALAALLVLGLHTLLLGLHPQGNGPTGVDLFMPLLPFLARGYLGVDFFFVLSGFIITHVYLASLARPNRRATVVFLWHRFIRLYPVHVTVLALLVVVVSLARAADIPLNHPQSWPESDLVWHFTLLHAWGVTPLATWNSPSWSISAEWFAYLLFPLLAPLLMRIRRRGTALLVAAAALATTAAVFTLADWTLLEAWIGAPALIRVSGEFLCGAALCRAIALGGELRRASGDIIGAGALLFFLLGASSGMPEFILVVLLALTVLGAATSRGALAWLLSSRPLLWLGEISYSIYIVHFPVLLLIRRLWDRLGFAGWSFAAQTLAFLATLALVIVLAALLFYVVERPARTRLRDQLGRA